MDESANTAAGKSRRKSPGAFDGLLIAATVILARIGIAGVFFRSGQTKIDGPELFWGIKFPTSINESTFALFADEYQVPFFSPTIAAYLAAAAELILPILLILGLFTRFSALALLVMVGVIQFYVYPGLWPDHSVWAAALIVLVARGAGPVSFDAAWESERRRPKYSKKFDPNATLK